MSHPLPNSDAVVSLLGVGDWIDRHKYSEAQRRTLTSTNLYQTLQKIYSMEAPQFLRDKGFPAEVSHPSLPHEFVVPFFWMRGW